MVLFFFKARKFLYHLPRQAQLRDKDALAGQVRALRSPVLPRGCERSSTANPTLRKPRSTRGSSLLPGSRRPPSPATGQRGSPRAIRPVPAPVGSVLALLQKQPSSIGDCPELTQSHLYFCPKTSSFSQSQQLYYTVAGLLSEPSSKSPARTLGPPTFHHRDI